MQTFDSWKSVNEGVLKNRGRQVIVSPEGKRQVAVYKVQGNDRFMIKLIKMKSIIDEGGQLTTPGQSIIKDFINHQMAIVQAIGQLNDAWFTDKALSYKVKRDTQFNQEGGKRGREKIQFIVINRADYPELPAGIQFVNAILLEEKPVKDELEDLVINDDTPEDPIDQDEEQNQGEEDVIDDQEGGESALIGKKFRYYMRTNRKEYLMEFTSNGVLDCDVIGDTYPNGVISWEDPKINWTTDYDERRGWEDLWEGESMTSDQEITNKVDYEFLKKIFTDPDFRDRIIKEYEDEWASSEINPENLRSLLYYRNGTKIFATETASAPETRPEGESEGGGRNLAGGEYKGVII